MNFRFQDLVAVMCIVLMLCAVVLPAWTGSAGRSRRAVCSNNMKLIGVGLEMWRKNAKTGRYPTWDMPSFAGGGDLGPWCEMIAMVDPFTPENIEANRYYLESVGMPPEDFSKTVDSMKIFRCPADHPHPHRINEERSHAWGFDPYRYSYSINTAVATRSGGAPTYAEDASSQVLSPDGLWTWSMNLSGYYVDDPSGPFSYPSWSCNTVGYFHKGNSANFVLRDGHVENHRWNPEEGLPDTEDNYFMEPAFFPFQTN